MHIYSTITTVNCNYLLFTSIVFTWSVTESCIFMSVPGISIAQSGKILPKLSTVCLNYWCDWTSHSSTDRYHIANESLVTNFSNQSPLWKSVRTPQTNKQTKERKKWHEQINDSSVCGMQWWKNYSIETTNSQSNQFRWVAIIGLRGNINFTLLFMH